MKVKKINVGQEIGNAIVIECDSMDAFGNPKPNSYPMVLESNLNDSIHHTRERVKKHLSFKENGRVLICKLIVVEEIFDSNSEQELENF